MPTLPTTSKRQTAEVLPEALGLLLALPLSLAGTLFLTYLVYAASHLGS